MLYKHNLTSFVPKLILSGSHNPLSFRFWYDQSYTKHFTQENKTKAEKIEKILSVPAGSGRKRQIGGSRGEKSLRRTKKGQTGDPNVSEGKKGR